MESCPQSSPVSEKDKRARKLFIEMIINYMASANLTPEVSELNVFGKIIRSHRYIDDDNSDIICSSDRWHQNGGSQMCFIYYLGSTIMIAYNQDHTLQVVSWFNKAGGRGILGTAIPDEGDIQSAFAILPSSIMGDGLGRSVLGQDYIVFHSANLRDAAIILSRDIIDRYGDAQFKDGNEYSLTVPDISDEVAGAIVAFGDRANGASSQAARRESNSTLMDLFTRFTAMDRNNFALILSQLGMMRSRAKM